MVTPKPAAVSASATWLPTNPEPPNTIALMTECSRPSGRMPDRPNDGCEAARSGNPLLQTTLDTDRWCTHDRPADRLLRQHRVPGEAISPHAQRDEKVGAEGRPAISRPRTSPGDASGRSRSVR